MQTTALPKQTRQAEALVNRALEINAHYDDAKRIAVSIGEALT